jgi:hypothetical protein
VGLRAVTAVPWERIHLPVGTIVQRIRHTQTLFNLPHFE